MIDLCDLVKKYYYNPLTGGSNSIKKVLPAALASSPFLQDKYGKPIYGAKGGIPSLNFTDWTWLTVEDGKVSDPYKRLPGLFDGYDEGDLNLLYGDDRLADGGAAMTAYAMMQFTDMSDKEREAIMAGLLKYCELDTLAMVMLIEHFMYDLAGDVRDVVMMLTLKNLYLTKWICFFFF
jgi:hypothetical protein